MAGDLPEVRHRGRAHRGVGIALLLAGHGDTLAICAVVAWVKDKTFRMEYEITVGERRCAAGFEVRAG
jgi:hypothetical protein